MGTDVSQTSGLVLYVLLFLVREKHKLGSKLLECGVINMSEFPFDIVYTVSIAMKLHAS